MSFSWLEGNSFKGAYTNKNTKTGFLDAKQLFPNNCAELSLSESETYILNFPGNSHGHKNVGKGGLARCALPNPKCLKTNLSALRLGNSLSQPANCLSDRFPSCYSIRSPPPFPLLRDLVLDGGSGWPRGRGGPGGLIMSVVSERSLTSVLKSCLCGVKITQLPP